MKTLAVAVLMIALVGCKRAPKIQTESTVAPSDVKALAYVKMHDCAFLHRNEGDISFDYATGKPIYHGGGYTSYLCADPKLYIFIEDAPVGGRP